MFRFIHTSDWHLGQKLGSFDRASEHDRFLQWLLGIMDTEQIHGLIVSGDIFDYANPSNQAMRMFTHFLVKARKICRNIVFVGGNHDSAMRLETLQPILKEIGIHMTGRISENQCNCLVPFIGEQGKVVAQVGAVPYLHPTDLPPPPEGESGSAYAIRLQGAVVDVYDEVARVYHRVRKNAEPLLVTGHIFIQGGIRTEESERPIQVDAGNMIGFTPDIFPAESAYVALGHLHRPQVVSGPVPVYYSGSPIPLSFEESRYEHHVLLITMDDSGVIRQIDTKPVPLTVDMLDLEGSLDEVRKQLEEEAGRYPLHAQKKAIGRVTVRLDRPTVSLREAILEIVEGTGISILSIRCTGAGVDLLDGIFVSEELETLTPLQVFILKYKNDYGAEPRGDLVQAFQELVKGVEIEEEPGAVP